MHSDTILVDVGTVLYKLRFTRHLSRGRIGVYTDGRCERKGQEGYREGMKIHDALAQIVALPRSIFTAVCVTSA
jgi:hypothetical protein